MPRIVATPIVIKQVNYWEIIAVHIYAREMRATVDVLSGYMENEVLDEESIEIVPVQVDGQSFIDLIGEVIDGETLYEAIKVRGYALAVAKGKIPANAEDV